MKVRIEESELNELRSRLKLETDGRTEVRKDLAKAKLETREVLESILDLLDLRSEYPDEPTTIRDLMYSYARTEIAYGAWRFRKDLKIAADAKAASGALTKLHAAIARIGSDANDDPEGPVES